MSLVFGFIVGRVEVVASTGKACLHDAQVLIGEGKVDDEVGLVTVEELFQLVHAVSVYLSCLDGHLIAFGVDSVDELDTFFTMVAGNHELTKHIGVLCNLESTYRGNATGSNHQYFVAHNILVLKVYCCGLISSLLIPNAFMSE